MRDQPSGLPPASERDIMAAGTERSTSSALTALANLLPILTEEDSYLALFQGGRFD